jgi:hypothetical protein
VRDPKFKVYCHEKKKKKGEGEGQGRKEGRKER